MRNVYTAMLVWVLSTAAVAPLAVIDELCRVVGNVRESGDQSYSKFWQEQKQKLFFQKALDCLRLPWKSITMGVPTKASDSTHTSVLV